MNDKPLDKAIGLLKLLAVSAQPVDYQSYAKSALRYLEVITPPAGQAASTRLAEAMGVIEEMREELQDGCLWVRQMREGVNRWAGSIEMCGLDARQQNLDSWANRARAVLTTAERFMKGEK